MATIALDYDGTFTVDPALWTMFVKTAQSRGHTVYLVTMRHDTPGEASQVRASFKWVLDNTHIIFTGRKAKRKFLNALGINIDIWIDDNPVWIAEDSL